MALYTCKKCGKQVPMQYEICPYCRTPRPEIEENTEPVPQKKKKHPILSSILAALGMLTVLFIVVIALVIIEDENKEPTKDGAESETVFGVGDQVSVDDVLVTLVDAYEHEGEHFSTPEDGKVFVVFEFEIENNSSRDIAVNPPLTFDAYVDDYSIIRSHDAIKNSSKNDLVGDVAPGKKMNGVIGYEVPQDWKSIEIKFTPYFSKPPLSNKDITFTYSK